MGGRRIMIVGNGPVPEGAAGLIDAADLVIRFNDCRSVGAGGSRTDIVAVCNTGRPGKAMAQAGWAGSPPVRAAAAIWCVRDPEKFAAMREPLSRSHPDLDDFCDDYTAGFAGIAVANGKAHLVLSRACHEALEAELAVHAPPPYVVPSSGLVTIAHVLSSPAFADDAVCLAGFGHQGWEWHPFAAERAWVEAHVAAGRLSRIDSLLGATLSSHSSSEPVR